MKNINNNKRIAFIIGSMRRGGAERVISILANSYAARGWSVDIITLLDDSNDYILEDSIVVRQFGSKIKSRIRQLPHWLSSIRSYVKENNPEYIVSFIARINIITLISCMGLNKSIVVSERSDPRADGRSIFINFATRMLYPFSKYIIFQTKWAQSCFSKRIQAKGKIINNPIHITAHATINKRKKIVAVGRLYEEKNHKLLINAFKNIHERYPEYKLFIFGEGKLRSLLEKQIDELDLKSAVFLPGNVEDIHDNIADAEMFVLPSNYEGLSNALLEAMMMGLPCISTDCSGSNEIIDNGYNGILINRGNEEQLYQAIETLIIDKKKAATIAKNGKKSVEHMNKSNVIVEWEKAIEK